MSSTPPPDQSPSLSVQGYFSLTCIALGMVLFGLYGPNDIWTSLLVGAVFGGIAARPLLNFLYGAWNWVAKMRR